MKICLCLLLATITLVLFIASASLAAERAAIFYYPGKGILDVLGDPANGVPNDPNHLYIFTTSSPSGPNEAYARLIHSYGSSFKYGPCFDVDKYAKKGFPILKMDEEGCKKVAHEFRDKAIAAGADFFGYNECFSNTWSDPKVRQKVGWMLKYINEPDANGKRIYGILYFVEKNCFPERWKSDAAPEFWKVVNETCRFVIAEHYHGHGFLNENSETYLKDHYGSWYQWFKNSKDPNMRQIADEKYGILHSSRWGPGTSGWAGGISDKETLVSFRNDLAKAVWLSRTLGNPNVISFGPVSEDLSHPLVYKRIRDLLKWHYNQPGSENETKPYEPFTFATKGANAVGVR